MSPITNEATFESAIIQSLVDSGGYIETKPENFGREIALDKEPLIKFVKDTQPNEWAKLEKIHGSAIATKFIERLVKELDLMTCPH